MQTRRQAIFSYIRDLIKKLHGVEEIIFLHSNISSLGLDELDFIEIIMHIEKEYSIELSDSEIDSIKKIHELIDKIYFLTSKKLLSLNIKNNKMSTLKTGVTKTPTKKATAKLVTTTGSVEKVNYTFPDGTEFKGTIDQLTKVASALGLKISLKTFPKGFYPSESKGLVKISEMNEFHIRRALLKASRSYYALKGGPFENDKDLTNEQFLTAYTGLANLQVVQDLYSELEKRK